MTSISQLLLWCHNKVYEGPSEVPNISRVKGSGAPLSKMFVEPRVCTLPVQTCILCAAESRASINSAAHVLQQARSVRSQVDKPGKLLLHRCRKMDISAMDCKSSVEIEWCHEWSFYHVAANITPGCSVVILAVIAPIILPMMSRMKFLPCIQYTFRFQVSDIFNIYSGFKLFTTSPSPAGLKTAKKPRKGGKQHTWPASA